jgi:hypothetical protein
LVDGPFAGAPASGCIKSVIGLGAASFDASLWLFSLGLTVDRIGDCEHDSARRRQGAGV